mmetsp:Transcript_13938/g.58190  ORF Transcript_13938/g.58190 Transcript_13938/m.58190 type:complete len:209 (-) Transcript_13938:497-1123(-)
MAQSWPSARRRAAALVQVTRRPRGARRSQARAPPPRRGSRSSRPFAPPSAQKPHAVSLCSRKEPSRRSSATLATPSTPQPWKRPLPRQRSWHSTRTLTTMIRARLLRPALATAQRVTHLSQKALATQTPTAASPVLRRQTRTRTTPSRSITGQTSSMLRAATPAPSAPCPRAHCVARAPATAPSLCAGTQTKGRARCSMLWLGASACR